MCVVEAQSLGRGVTLGQGLLPVDEVWTIALSHNLRKAGGR